MYNLGVSYKMALKKFTITKKIAKHGTQAVLVIPKLLEKDLAPGTVIELTLNILKEAEEWVLN